MSKTNVENREIALFSNSIVSNPYFLTFSYDWLPVCRPILKLTFESRKLKAQALAWDPNPIMMTGVERLIIFLFSLANLKG